MDTYQISEGQAHCITCLPILRRRLRHVSGHDALRQALSNSSLAHTCTTKQQITIPKDASVKAVAAEIW
jgi:hypothetical protein